MLPNFLCIGAQKCGTTSLWHILHAHPDVFLAQPRETQFFSDDELYDKGVAHYGQQYFSEWSGQQAVGEKCPEYLYVPESLPRIQKALGKDIRLIVSLRNPAARAFSHYRHNLKARREDRTFLQALEDEAARQAQGEFVAPPFGYIGRGFYAQQLQRLVDLFPRERILMVDFDRDICSDQKMLSIRLYRFLGLRPLLSTGLPFRTGRPNLENKTIRVVAEATRTRVEISESRCASGWKNRMATLLRHGRLRSLQRTHASSVRTADLRLPRNAVAEINRNYFAADIEQLQHIIGFDGKSWLSAAPEVRGSAA